MTVTMEQAAGIIPQNMLMYDDVVISLDPAGAFAYAGYVDGTFANFQPLEARFPGAHFLSIATNAGDDAACLDVEPGDATDFQIFTWFKRQQARGAYRPCIYTSASNMRAVQATMAANGFPRSSYRMWSAHYTFAPHLCAPATCGFGLDTADATQYTDHALGRSLDASLLSGSFFAPPPPPPPPPGKAAQPSKVDGSARYTNASVTWSGARDVASYWVTLLDGLSGALIDRVSLASTAPAGSYIFRHLKEQHKYTLGIYARHGMKGSHSQWVTVTTE